VTTTASEPRTKGAAAREASRALARLSAETRNAAIFNIADGLLRREADILAANAKDMEEGRTEGLSEALLDRLLLTHERLEGMAADARQIASLPDPIGEVSDMRTLANGLQLGRRRVPLGVIAAIYESRPNVTVDIASLCLKSGNACILRGGKEAIHSNAGLASVVRQAVVAAGVPENAVQMIENTDRALVAEILQMRDVIDLLIPRGGARLVRFVAENATMPVVTGGIGVCHTYVDAAADIDMAVAIAHNAKTRRPSICNALDTLLVHETAAHELLTALGRRWAEAGVEMRCDDRSLRILNAARIDGLSLKPAEQDDFGTEFLALIAAVRVVDSLDEALDHIERHGSGHSEAIVTSDYAASMRFLDEVDAAAVYVNASTQFTDGAQFGLGAEVGISTQKMHARGPMGPRELTSYKWIILGGGQTRPS
jgi:glutamate-5-semialdehyde dehydrogenase